MDTTSASQASVPQSSRRMHRIPEMSATTEHLLIRNIARDYAEGTESQRYLRQVRRAYAEPLVLSVL